MKTKEYHGGTPYDDVFRTLTAKSGSLFIPFVNELFQFKESLGADAVTENPANGAVRRPW